MASSDNHDMENPVSAPDYTQMILEQLQQIRQHNEAKFDLQRVRDRFKSNGLIVFLLKQLKNG